MRTGMIDATLCSGQADTHPFARFFENLFPDALPAQPSVRSMLPAIGCNLHLAKPTTAIRTAALRSLPENVDRRGLPLQQRLARPKEPFAAREMPADKLPPGQSGPPFGLPA